MQNGGTTRRQHSTLSIPHFPLAVPAVLALVFFAFHVPYLPTSLEDLDSINFALGLRQFDVARHQPHPPGYPLFIAAAKAVRLLVPADAAALALLGAVAGALGVIAIAALARRVDDRDDPRVWMPATALAVAAPLYWFTADRPLSDMSGLAAAVAVQVLILRASTAGAFAAAAFCAGFAVGLRSQVFWLTAPLLLASGFGIRRSGVDRRTPRPDCRIPALAYALGVAAWAIPLVVVSGGPRAYWRALFEQGGEDLSGIRMLWTTPTPRELVDAGYYAFVAPWAAWPLAAIVLALAALGAVASWRRGSRALTAIAIAFGPYLIFDLLFQETFTSRYALPLVVPIAYFAAAGAAAVPANAGLAVAIGAAMFGAHVGGTSLAAYARGPAPAFRLLADMQGASTTEPPVLAMDRREALDLRGPAKWLGDRMPPHAPQLPSPPQHEWREAVSYWNRGGRAPVWFIADPARTDVDLIQHGDPRRYRWSLPYPVLLDGVRPNEMDWYELAAPEWWLGDGWALTPETAGVAEHDGRGLSRGPIEGYLAQTTLGGAAVIGGRSFEPQTAARLEVRVGDRAVDAFDVPPGSFVRAIRLPADAGGGRIVPLTIAARPPSRLAVEQFDASASRTLVAFDRGWHEQELNPSTGRRWRWLSERGDLRIVSPAPVGGLVVHLEGESPLTYFSRPSTLTVRADGDAVFTTALGADFSLTIPIARPAATVTIETDQIYVPAERSRRSPDRRHLGLRIFRCEVRPVSAPGR